MPDFILVIGAGQAGLAAGYCLQKAGVPFAIVDEVDRIGDSWRARYDSLTVNRRAKLTPDRHPKLTPL